MNKTVPRILLMFLLLVSVAEAQEYDYDVPFVPTRNEVLDVMLSMAKVTKDDVLYDLGCGDGRIVVTAAKRFGCHGVGIDINPVRIAESKENAAKAKVTDSVRFIEQNLFDADIREATVVTLYLLPDVNLKLRPNLIKQLKPGTRVVSHNYSMGDWEADASKEVEVKDSTHDVYFWVVPANVSGTWRVTIPAAAGTKEYVITLNQKFQQVDGIVKMGSMNHPILEFKVTGDGVVFSLEGTGGEKAVPMRFEGKVNGDSMSGVAAPLSGQSKTETTWKAVRNPGTSKLIDAEGDNRR